MTTPTAFKRFEFVTDIALPTINVAVQPATQGGQLPNDRFMFGLLLQYQGRIANNAGPNNPTGVQADAPYGLIEKIHIEGYHRVRGQQEPFYDVRGSDARQLNQIYTAHAPLVQPAVFNGPYMAQNLSLNASANNDIRFSFGLPFTMDALPIRQQASWLLDAPNYDRLQMTINNADDRSVFTGGMAGTFTAINSGAGNPILRVGAFFAMQKQQWTGFVPGRIFRYFQEVVGGDFTNNLTGAREYNFPRGYRIRSLLIKTGIKATNATAGNNVYASLSDTILANIKVNRGINKIIRFYPDCFMLKEEVAQNYGLRPDTGYHLIDFVPNGAQSELLDSTGLVAGPSGDTDLFITTDITGAANQAALFLIQEARFLSQVATPAS